MFTTVIAPDTDMYTGLGSSPSITVKMLEPAIERFRCNLTQHSTFDCNNTKDMKNRFLKVCSKGCF